MNRSALLIFGIVLSLSLSLITVMTQFQYIYRIEGYNSIYREEYGAHLTRISSTSSAPYRYRLLTDHALAIIMKLFHAKDNHERAHIFEQVAYYFRIGQNIIIFLFSLWYFRTLKFSFQVSFVGLIILAYGLCFAFFASGLSFNIYTQIAFFLLAAIFINLQKDEWIIPLTILAALNREEAIFIPVMLMASRFVQINLKSPDKHFILTLTRRVLLSIIGFFVIYWGLRYILGPAPYDNSRYGAVYPGMMLIQLNAFNPNTWIGLFEMYNGLPLFILLFKKWPAILKSYLILLVAPWFILEFAFGSADETRLFLVPLFITFVPAALSLFPILNTNLQENRI
jgi:hypothetical protein